MMTQLQMVYDVSITGDRIPAFDVQPGGKFPITWGSIKAQ